MSKKQLEEDLRSYGITEVSQCACGAYTVQIGHESYSISNRKFFKEFTRINKSNFYNHINKIVGRYSNCNHCVNGWGLDLCCCGSGKPYDKCDETRYCGTPMQVIGSYKNIKGDGSWG